jgi:iron complex outermembrane receptor protein
LRVIAPCPPGRREAPAAAESEGIEQIVVTAQRREQALQDVPIAVTAFTGET